MAIISGYYNSINGDRKYNAETMSRYFAGLFSRGVLQNYKGKFTVKPGDGMSVVIPTGKAYFSDGKWIENTSDIVLDIDASDVILNRVDSIVLRSDTNDSTRNAAVLLKKGTPAVSPLPPALQNSGGIEELRLCTIAVNKLAKNISQANILNTIPDISECGYVTGLIEQVDTGDLFLQYKQAYEEFRSDSQKRFDDWFADVKETMSKSTLIRQYTSHYATTKNNETVIPIQIPQYAPVLDVLNVFINGLKLINDLEYTKTADRITLKMPLEVGQIVDFEVFKSVDGSQAETVVQQVYDLQQLTNQHSGKIRTLESVTADSGWQKLKLGSGVTEYNAATYPVRCRKIGKQVFIEGLISNTVALNTTVATIPDGYRPAKNQIITVPVSKQTTGRSATLIFFATGEIKIEALSTSDSLVSGDYVSLKTCYLID